MRTIVDLPEEQIKALDSYAKSKGISRAAAVRESVAAYLPAKPKKKDAIIGATIRRSAVKSVPRVSTRSNIAVNSAPSGIATCEGTL